MLNWLSVLIRVQAIRLLCPSRRKLRFSKTQLFTVISVKATMAGLKSDSVFSTTEGLSPAPSKRDFCSVTMEKVVLIMGGFFL